MATVDRHGQVKPSSDLIEDADLRTLLESAPSAYLILLPDLTIAGATDEYLRLTMTTREALIGRGVFDVFFPEDEATASSGGQTTLRASLDRVIEHGGTDMMLVQRYDIRTPDGTFVERHWTTSNTAVPGRAGGIAYIISYVQDFTEHVIADRARVDQLQAVEGLQARYDQARLQSMARESALLKRIVAERDQLRLHMLAKDEFLQTISHELNSPVTTIRGNAQILLARGGDLEAEDVRDALHDLVLQSDRLVRTVANLLLLARPELGEGAEPEPFIVAHIVQRLADEHCRAFPARDVSFVATGAEAEVADCVQTYFEQVLHNLLTNAEKYSPSEGPIEIRVTRDDNDVSVRVLDKGKGFTAEQAEHIFEPFYRIDDDRVLRPGLGIGLTVAKRLVDAMSGHIWVATRPEGGGEVGFSLPVAESDD